MGLFGLVRMYVIFVIDLASRKVEVAGICRSQTALDGPNGAQSPRCGGRLLARKAVPPRGPRPAVHEGVSGSSHPSRDQGSATSGEEPNLNAFAERFVLSVRSECLDRIIPLGDWHLRHAVSEYLKHYHQERNHQGWGMC